MIIKDNFCQFCIKTYVVTPHLNRLNETVHMRGHNIWIQREIRKIIPQLSSNTLLIYLELCCYTYVFLQEYAKCVTYCFVLTFANISH